MIIERIEQPFISSKPSPGPWNTSTKLYLCDFACLAFTTLIHRHHEHISSAHSGLPVLATKQSTCNLTLGTGHTTNLTSPPYRACEILWIVAPWPELDHQSIYARSVIDQTQIQRRAFYNTSNRIGMS
jgi:hypothetical protein